MAAFRIEIEADGGHGCDRRSGESQHVHGCRKMDCVDCELRRFLEHLRVKNLARISVAKLIHYPGEAHQVIDDLVTGKRHGRFAA